MGDPLIESRPFGDHYFRWLAEDMSLHESEDHWALLHQLYCKPYYWIVNGDAALVDDVLEMRSFYGSIWKTDISKLDEVNCLEVIRYLSTRLASMVTDNNEREWFWEMLTNLKLDKLSDFNFVKYGGTETVNYRLAVWLTRRYNPDGHGGLFPLHTVRFFFGNNDDQTKKSTYEQIVEYLRCAYRLWDIDRGELWI